MAPLHLVLFSVFEKSFVCSCLCLSRGKEVATRPSALARVKSAWEFGGIAASAASPLAPSPHARRSREISAAGCGYPKPAGWLSSSRVAAPPSPPFAGVGLQSSQLRHGLRCLFRSGGPRPVFLSMSVLRGLQSAHPPSPVELLQRGTLLPEGGSNVSPLSCVSCVPAYCVHIWFVSCPCLM